MPTLQALNTEQILQVKDPLKLLQSWFEEAGEKATYNKETEATAMTVATVDSDGQPSTRVVLLKQFTEQGFLFYTNYHSQKGLELSQNSQLAVNFHWPFLGRQISILATAEKTSRQVSEAYWNTRPKSSQLSQALSLQSQPVESGVHLQQKFDEFCKKFEGKEVPCPENWGGYEVTPHHIQFWVAQPTRLHDRVMFEKSNNQWVATPLYP